MDCVPGASACDDVSLEKFVRADGTFARYVGSFQFRVLEIDPGGPDYGEMRTIGPLGPQQGRAWKSSSKVSVPSSGARQVTRTGASGVAAGT